MAETKREYWTPQEDAKLMEYVNADGTADWDMAAKSFVDEEGNVRKTRSSCYQRYKDHLAPGLVHGDFTDQEIYKIETLLALHGKRWAFIASQLRGRTGNAVKNWYHKQVAKKARELKQALAAAPAGGPTIGGYLYDGDGHGVDVSNWGDGEGGDEFGGNINQQFLNNGTGYNQPLAGAGFGDSNQQLAGVGFDDDLLWDFNDQKFINNNGASSSGGGGGAYAGAATDDDLDQYLNYLSTTGLGPSDNSPSA